MTTSNIAGNAVLMIRYTSGGGPGVFMEFGSLGELCDGICELYERGLKLCLSSGQAGNGKQHVSYGIAELMDYLDAAESVAVLVRHSHSMAGREWTEQDREWTKRTLVSHLKQQLFNNTIA